MITTVTANPCMDKTVTTPAFDMYTTNRVQLLEQIPAGKGINVVRALKALGTPVSCTGFTFCNEGEDPLTALLAREGIPADFIPISGSLRLCTKVFDESRSMTIELNEQGTAVPVAAGEALLERVEKAAQKSDFLVLSGSLPAGLPADFYATCVQRARAAAPACRIVVDAQGESLKAALDAGPYLIKPNLAEFEAAFDCGIKDITALDRRVKKLFSASSVETVCVSMGERGSYIADRSGAYYCPCMAVPVRALQGAGDAMVAGLCHALAAGASLAEALRMGTAASAASVMRAGTTPPLRADFDRLLAAVPAPQKLR